MKLWFVLSALKRNIDQSHERFKKWDRSLGQIILYKSRNNNRAACDSQTNPLAEWIIHMPIKGSEPSLEELIFYLHSWDDYSTNSRLLFSSCNLSFNGLQTHLHNYLFLYDPFCFFWHYECLNDNDNDVLSVALFQNHVSHLYIGGILGYCQTNSIPKAKLPSKRPCVDQIRHVRWIRRGTKWAVLRVLRTRIKNHC